MSNDDQCSCTCSDCQQGRNFKHTRGDATPVDGAVAKASVATGRLQASSARAWHEGEEPLLKSGGSPHANDTVFSDAHRRYLPDA